LTESQSEKFVKRLVGRTDIEDAMKKLDKLTQEEALMTSAGSLELLRDVDDKIDTVIDGAQNVSACSSSLLLTFILLGGNQARIAIQQIGNNISGLNRS
jgi:hypothetical protein